MTEDVHQRAINKVLSTFQVKSDSQLKLTGSDIALIMEQQLTVDNHQQASDSYLHSMTGIENAAALSHAEDQKKAYIKRTTGLIHECLKQARDLTNSNRESRLLALAYAIHALEDATSPSHAPFQQWRWDQVGFLNLITNYKPIWNHLEHERFYPANGNPYQARLENSVRWAYELYLGTVPEPAQFFDPEGNLMLDQCYKPDSKLSSACTQPLAPSKVTCPSS